jgi:two-component system, cell cycle response regulator
VSQRVLIIDDSQTIHAIVRARLSGEALELTSAHDGDSGLRAATENPPDLILLDVDMPDLNGFEVCKRLRSDVRTMGVPVIFLTGASSSEEKINGLELGACDYVTKPFDPAELRARVRSTLRSKYLMDLLSRKAQIDGLTGLWNRAYFDRRLREELSSSRRSGRPLSMILADVDHFKSCNDRFGHSFGDEVLRRVAARMTEVARIEDVTCRYGGEEFSILSPGTCIEGAIRLAERLRVALSEIPLQARSTEVKITASFGVASHTPAVTQNFEGNEKSSGEIDAAAVKLIDAADAALYAAKEQGRNRVVSLTTRRPPATPPLAA